MCAVALALAVTVFAAGELTGQTRPEAVQDVSNTERVDVVIVAHADDWQVFMGDAIVERIQSGTKPVFIYLTAGDHGRDSLYWHQREQAALESTRIAIGAPASARASCSPVHSASHTVNRCVLGSSTSFFLRLPDGNRNGAGFARNRFESLRKLKANKLALHSVDGAATYENWQQLVTTVGALLHLEGDAAASHEIVLHATDPSARINPHDHYDHRMAGKLAEQLLQADKLRARYYVGYALATRSPNRTTQQRREKDEVFSAYDREMMRINESWSAYREHPAFYADCMERTYARSVIWR